MTRRARLQVGFKYEVDSCLNIACKSSKDVPSAVATYKLSKDATVRPFLDEFDFVVPF
jgi:hypothetical protein